MTYEEIYETMNNMDQKLVDALYVFQHQYPNVTSGDLQTFIMGWKAAVSEIGAQMEIGMMNGTVNAGELE
jgi:hypothetical protein